MMKSKISKQRKRGNKLEQKCSDINNGHVTVDKLSKKANSKAELSSRSSSLASALKKKSEIRPNKNSALQQKTSISNEIKEAPISAASVDGVCCSANRLCVPGGFSWDADQPLCVSLPGAEERVNSDDEQPPSQGKPQSPSKRLSRNERVERAKQEERQLFELERRRLDEGYQLETAEDYERLVVATPDDSSCWIRYMSHLLQATEIEKARAVAQRALKTISFRLEDEKLNVYMAWLNLESLHGTHDSLSNVLHEAVQANDPFQVYTRMAEVYMANNKPHEAEQMFVKLARKMSSNIDVWVRYGVFLMSLARADDARVVMQRALKSLDRRDHVQLISRFAQLEFRFGDSERGRTMFDNLLASYPRRLDQWLVYVTQLRRFGDLESARRVFSQMIKIPFGVRRMRSVFKHWLEFEQEHGSPQDEEMVRKQARAYVESKPNSA